ncbi:hypothetical protein LCGC14_0413950 [marine sediment metagenome]|uniref:YspA cpYpsA-related SLOG domain-containing protein n=1 Tax=marine sediment metagenome TaxID=412755 RepID=A0A0F9SYU7_9ZZZZ
MATLIGKVLVCGGRNFDNKKFLHHVLNQYLISHLIQGGAKGADKLARQWALERGISVTSYHADWDKYGKGAGFIRNFAMLLEGRPDLVIAFPGGKGTAHMVKIAKKKKIPIIEVTEEMNNG